MSTALTPEQKVIDYLAVSSTAIEKQAAALAAHEKVTKAANALVPDFIEAAIRAGFIQEHQKEAAAAALKDPVKLVKFATNCCTIAAENAQAAKGPPSLGGPDGPTKTASANDRNAERPAWAAFRQAIVGNR